MEARIRRFQELIAHPEFPTYNQVLRELRMWHYYIRRMGKRQAIRATRDWYVREYM